jgi:hypothetical protein
MDHPPRPRRPWGRHHRHVHLPAKRRFRPTLPIALIGVGVALLTCLAGFALGLLTIGQFSNSPPQSTAYGVITSAPGVSFVEAELELVNGTTVPATGGCLAPDLGTAAAPTPLVNAAASSLCLSSSAGGYAQGDEMFVLEIAWNATAANATLFKVQISVDVIPSVNDLVVTSYVKTTSAIAPSEQAVYSLDLGQAGDTSVVQYASVVTQL